MKEDVASLTDDPFRDQLRGFARSLAEMEWLILILVLLYLAVPDAPVTDRDMLIAFMVAYSVFIVGFHYTNFLRSYRQWWLAVETWMMILFITAVVWATGQTESALVNLYLLAIIASALTLTKLMTLLEVGLIAACYVLLGFHQGADVFSLAYVSRLMAELAPFLLVAYLTTMLANDVHQANTRIHALAGTDDLTGLLNMRGFMSIAQREHQRAERYASAYTLAMVDMDNLKSINDQFGHETGNHAIRKVAIALKDSIRTTDALARFGGDEFILLLVETDPESALEVVRRIQLRLDNLQIKVGRETVKPCASIGIAGYPRHGTEFQALLVAADEAMYKEKAGKHAQSNQSEMPV